MQCYKSIISQWKNYFLTQVTQLCTSILFPVDSVHGFIFFAQLDVSVLSYFSPSPNWVSRESLWVYGLEERWAFLQQHNPFLGRGAARWKHSAEQSLTGSVVAQWQPLVDVWPHSFFPSDIIKPSCWWQVESERPTLAEYIPHSLSGLAAHPALQGLFSKLQAVGRPFPDRSPLKRPVLIPASVFHAFVSEGPWGPRPEHS